MDGQDRINPSAFIWALILAPLVTGLPAFAVLWVLGFAEIYLDGLSIVLGATAIATVLGAPTYLTFGTAAFVIALRRRRAHISRTGLVAGFVANLVSAPIVFVLVFIFDASEAWGMTVFIVGFGCIFAPLWGWICGALYARFTSISSFNNNNLSPPAEQKHNSEYDENHS